MEELVGTVERFLFQNNENGFCVFILNLTKKETTTVSGYIPALQSGQQITLKGAWVMHPKFGKQFQAEQFSISLPTSITGLKKYLGSGMIKGIGKVYAEKLVDHFGSQVLQIIEQEPEKLKNVPGIGGKRLETIITAWKDQKEIANIMVFLQDKGVSCNFATKIYKQYGNNAITLITQNPYRIAQDIWGIGFKSADQLAQQLGFGKESLERITAGILHTIATHTSNGHLYVEVENLKSTALQLLELETNETHLATVKMALHQLHDQEKIKVISKDEQHFVTSSQLYFTEKSVANRLLRLQEHPCNNPLSPQTIHEIYQELRVEKPGEIALNEAQQHGIINCLQHKITVITGGPGTGKTTLIKKLLSILDLQKLQYRLAAPTGRAAKRMTEGTGKYAVTLHRLLEFNPQAMNFIHNEQNALKLDYLVVDEASMIDIFLANALLKAMPLTGHIIFIGDIDQLPSVGAGNFLQDIIASKIVPTTRLQYIFRQAQNSLITYNAHRINQGEFPAFKVENTKQDYEFVKLTEPEQLAPFLNTLFTTKLKRYGIKPEQAMVLSPMNRGAAGTHAINHYLQSIINPEIKPEISRMGTVFKTGDRVMQIKNNYDKNVFNGDIGTISNVDHQEKQLTVLYDQTPVVYEFLELDELVLAYAISIHKSQGSEFDAVIIPLFTQHFMLLQRNLLYTALTRAKKCCILVGQTRAIAMAIKNNKSIKRITFLQDYLTSNLTCR